jgi:rubrerythrin
MTAIWNGNVLLDTIIQNEEKSVELYQYIASTLKDEDQKELFLSLSNDEERHAKIYKAIKRKFSEKSEIEIAEEDRDYLELMILNNIFSNGKDHMAEIKKLLETMDPYDLAEKLERDAILYVLELQELYPNLAPEEISIILKEERKHLRLVFTKKLDKLRK